MRHDEFDAALALARAEVEAQVESVLDAVSIELDDDGEAGNVIERIRLRLAAVFVSVDYDDEEL
jgi:hypothetical protein